MKEYIDRANESVAVKSSRKRDRGLQIIKYSTILSCMSGVLDQYTASREDIVRVILTCQ